MAWKRITLSVTCLCLTGAVEAEKRWRGHPDHVCYHCLLGRHPIGVSLEENMIEGENVCPGAELSEAGVNLFKKLGFQELCFLYSISPSV